MLSYIKKIFKRTIYKALLKQKGSFTYYGEKVFFPKHSTTFNVAIQQGIYEHEVLKFLLNNVKDNSVYLDIGANIGLMSIPILKHNKTVKVISLEASPNTFGYLKKTWEHTQLKDRWLIYNKAVNNNNEDIDLFISSNADGSYESIKDTGRTEFSRKIKVQGITIDQLWLSLEKPSVSVIKSDIEGADLLALQGAQECINHCKPLIIMEWNKINIRPFQFQQQDLLDFCIVNKYSCYAVPSIIPVTNAWELELHSIVTENFLLIPFS